MRGGRAFRVAAAIAVTAVVAVVNVGLAKPAENEQLGTVSVKLEHRIADPWINGESVVRGKDCEDMPIQASSVELPLEGGEPLCGFAGNPCVARFSVKSTQVHSPACNACYILTARQHATENDASCAGSACPKYERSILVRASISKGAARGGGQDATWVHLANQGWKRLCPFACEQLDELSIPRCVSSANHCDRGTVPDFTDASGLWAPGSAKRPQYFAEVGWRLADCTTGAILSEELGSAGSVGFLPNPPVGWHVKHWQSVVDESEEESAAA